MPFYHEILKLREAGIKVHYVLGNHDYWVQDFITDTLFDHTYFTDTEFMTNGKHFFVTHGNGYLSWGANDYCSHRANLKRIACIWLVTIIASRESSIAGRVDSSVATIIFIAKRQSSEINGE